MAHKAAETTHNINSTSGLLTNTKCSGGSRNFAKQTSLEDEERSGQPLKVDNDQLRATIEADSLATVWESCQRTQIDHMAIWHLKRTGKVKKLNKGVPRELTTNQKYCHCEVSSSLLCNNDEPRLDQTVTWDKKWIVYDNRWWSTQWLDQEEASKHFPKPNLHPKKVTVTLWWPVAHLIHFFAFWITAKSLYLGCMLSKSMRCTNNCNAWSQRWSTERAQFFPMTTPICMSHN